MAVKEYAKKVMNQLTNEIKNKIKTFLITKVLPIALIVIAVGILIVVIAGALGADFTLGMGGYNSIGIGTGWWWPIGSLETTTEGGKKFASGEPALGYNNISRAGRAGSQYNGPSGYYHDKGTSGAAIDIYGATNTYYVISIGKGKVIDTVKDQIADGVKSPAMGNYVTVDYGNGYVATYMHMYKGSIEVKVGDEVEYGQVIGKLGHSGNSTGAHLHLEMRQNGNYVDITEYVDPNNPRPVIMSGYFSMFGIEGESVEEVVWFTLRAAGYSEYSVAGVMGNMYYESGMNPGIEEYNPNSVTYARGIGLCQWTNGRHEQLVRFAQGRGKSWSDIAIQMEFLIAELTPTGGADGIVTQACFNEPYFTQWRNAKSVREAAVAFLLGFEIPADTGTGVKNQRTEKGEEYYKMFR